MILFFNEAAKSASEEGQVPQFLFRAPTRDGSQNELDFRKNRAICRVAAGSARDLGWGQVLHFDVLFLRRRTFSK